MIRGFLVISALLLKVYLFAQPGTLDLSFNPGNGSNYHIGATYILPNGKIMIAGAFSTYNGQTANHLARLYPNGQLDSSFNVGLGANENIVSFAVQADGKVIAGGNFTSFHGVSANKIMRVNADGTRDTSFHYGTGFNAEVNKVSVQTDGKILVGGHFTSYNGTAVNYLTRLNPDGSIDSTFNIGSGPNNTVEDIAIQPFDNKIIIVGDFTYHNGNLVMRITRLNTDGTRDNTFDSGYGATSVIKVVTVQDDGKILIGGNFNSYTFQYRNRIARLHSDGDLDTSFDPGTGANGEVRAIVPINPDINGVPNRILISGNITNYNGSPVGHISLLHSNGWIDQEFDEGTGTNEIIYSLSQQNDGRVIAGGSFATYNNISRKCIARIYLCQTAQPDSIVGSSTTRCPGETFVYAVPYSPYVDSYEWTLPTGWSGSSDSASITVTSNGQGGVISVVAFSDTCGYSIPMQKNISRIQPPETPICLVTVDSSSDHNIVIWGKPINHSFIDSFIIYRETTTNVYTKIAAVHRDYLSEYHDYGANPNATSYRYKLSVKDTCGVESDLSPFHNSIHLQNLGNGNLQWTFYQIENSTNPVSEFNVYRDNLGNGNFTQIGLVPGTNSTFTDISHASFPDAEYVVDVKWGISCSPVARSVNTTRSNIRKGSTVTIIDTTINDTTNNPIDTLVNDTTQNNDTVSIAMLMDRLSANVDVYPNPANGIVFIRSEASIQFKSIQIFDLPGKRVIQKSLSSNYHSIPIDGLQTGIYLIVIDTNLGQVRKKLFVR